MQLLKVISVLFAGLLVANSADAQAPWQDTRYGWGGLPAVNYNSDEGFGFGAVGSIYRYNGETNPYKWALTLQAFATTRGIHAHQVEFDGLELAGKGLRVNGRIRFESTRTDNYCGLGPKVPCDQAEAEALADQLGLVDDDRTEFTQRYYLNRFVYPHAWVNVRYPLTEMPHRVEVLGGLRFGWRIPGDFKNEGPFENSRYEQDFPDGEPGPVSVLQMGLMVDNRDFEPAPTKGYWAEFSLRGSAPFLGSGWTFGGFNATFRGYVSLIPDGRLVLADRVVIDGMVGNAPSSEYATPGGSQYYSLLGGEHSLRGVRLRRLRGPWTLLNQMELRWRVVGWRALNTDTDLVLLGFMDVGHVAVQASDFSRHPPVLGQGAGVRLSFDKTFIVRVDVGFSAIENWSPGVYIGLKNLF